MSQRQRSPLPLPSSAEPLSPADHYRILLALRRLLSGMQVLKSIGHHGGVRRFQSIFARLMRWVDDDTRIPGVPAWKYLSDSDTTYEKARELIGNAFGLLLGAEAGAIRTIGERVEEEYEEMQRMRDLFGV